MRAALDAYGAHDARLVDELQPLVVLHIAAWGSLASHVLHQPSPRTERRLEWLRTHKTRHSWALRHSTRTGSE
jgi:hypothetical protein